MVTDHSKLQSELASAAARNRVSFNSTPNSEHQQHINRLQALSGAEFDRNYMSLMIQAHQKDVGRFQSEAQSADSPEVRALVSRALPILQQHLSMAQQIGGQVQADVAAAPTTQPVSQTAQFKVDKADQEFVRDIAADNKLEVLLARLAFQKSTNAEIKQYAERENVDHNRQQDDWVALATRGGMPFKTGMGKHHHAKLKQLEKLSGPRFDRAYMTMEARNHRDYINYLEKEGRALKTSQLREQVEREIPVFMAHFNDAKRIGAQVGADVNVTLRSEKGSSNK
jgi:putative membrane protein